MKVADVRNFNQIKLILENKNEIKIEICDLEELDLFISLISKDLDKFPILMVLKAAIIEFVLNGFKAYQKRKFFEINNYSLFDDYEKGNELMDCESVNCVAPLCRKTRGHVSPKARSSLPSPS